MTLETYFGHPFSQISKDMEITSFPIRNFAGNDEYGESNQVAVAVVLYLWLLGTGLTLPQLRSFFALGKFQSLDEKTSTTNAKPSI